jgi:hypothetical protein
MKRLMWFCVLLLLLPQPTPATTINVPEDIPTIWQAVDLAQSGDSVLVGPGTWTDRDRRLVHIGPNVLWQYSCAFLKAGITVIGVEGPKNTIVDGGEVTDAGVTTILYSYEEGATTRIEGLTITGGGDGLLASNTDRIEVSECRFIENDQYGVYAGSSDVGLFGCEILDNYQSSDGTLPDAGVRFGGYALEMRGCRLARNRVTGLDVNGGQSVVIDNCEFVDQPWYRGAEIDNCPDVQITNSLFLRCASTTPASSGGGLVIDDSGGRIEFCVFAYDSARSSYGGGLAVGGSNVEILNNTFYRCNCEWYGAAVTISGTDAGFVGNIAAHCTGRGTLRKVGGPTNPETGCNLLWMNEGDDYSGDWVPADTDIYADPMFCDPEEGDYRVDVSSPAAEENSPVCGQIGAFGVGCGSVSVERVTWGRLKNLYRGRGEP